MATPITTKPARSRSRRVRLPGWLWFVALWCGGVGGGFAAHARGAAGYCCSERT